MIPIAEMIERQTNNRNVGGGILLRSLRVWVMPINVRWKYKVPSGKVKGTEIPSITRPCSRAARPK